MMGRLWRRKKPGRVLILGLDCAGPQLVFEQFQAHLPHLSALARQGTWGILNSSIPCITIPAWSSMLSSRDPGELGIYGFRNRIDHGYHNLSIANSAAVKVPRVWESIGAAGRQSVVMNVPQTFPVRPISGHLISCFLTPNAGSAFTYPAIFKQEALQRVSNYQFDVNDFRTADKANLLRRIIDFTEKQYQLVEYAISNKEWDFFIHVNMGVDRIHHGFWRYHDPQHRLHESDSPFRHALRDYYTLVDSWLGRIMAHAGEDTTILIVSDHGVKRMDGAICTNEWLRRTGWLVLKNPPPAGKITPFEALEVDWSKTRAWSTGGYYGRIFLNVQGREPEGIISQDSYESVRSELSEQIKAIPGANGEKLDTTIYYPEAIYRQTNNIAPDLLVYFGDLHWRTAGGLGYEQHFTLENDTGPDDANHATEGMFILYEPTRSGRGRIGDRQLMDIAPTILDRIGIDIPAEMRGNII